MTAAQEWCVCVWGGGCACVCRCRYVQVCVVWGCPKDIQPLNCILHGGKYFNLNSDTPLHEAYNYQVPIVTL